MTATFIILFLSLLLPVFLFSRRFYEKTKTKRLIKRGIEAQAVLLNVQPTGVYLNKLAEVKLQMQVYPKMGRNFVTEVCELMERSDLKQLQIGDVVLVKYNPSNTKELMVLML